MAELIEALRSKVIDESVPLATPVLTSVPASSSMLTNIYDKTKSAVSKAYDKTKSTARTFADWIISYVPEAPKRIVDEKIAAFKSQISSMYKAQDKVRVEESKTTIKVLPSNMLLMA